MPDTCDLLIIGGGLNGLTAAVAYAAARPDRRVTLLEQRPRVGGYVTTYHRGPWALDTCQMVPNLEPLLELLGVSLETSVFERCLRLVRIDPATGALEAFSVPTGQDAFLDAVSQRFPTERDAFDRFLREARSLYTQLAGLKLRPGGLDVLGMLFTAPGVIRHGSRSFASWFARFGIRDPLLLDVVGLFCELGSLPAERVHALVPVSVLCSLLDGANRPTAPFIALPRALEARARELGVTVQTRARVVEVLVDGHEVAGARLKDGREFRASRVICTVDPVAAMNRLVGLERLEAIHPGFARRVQAVEPSWSSFNLNLGLDEGAELSSLGLDAGYTVLTTGGSTLDEAYAACERGELPFTAERFHVGVVAPSLFAGGPPYLTIRAFPAAMADWARLRDDDRDRYRSERQRVAELLEGIVERWFLPGIGDHVRMRDPSTPATYARYSGSPTGSVYGMAPTVSNFGRTRLPMITPIRGLLLPSFVHGVYGAMLSGLQAADYLLDGSLMGGRGLPPAR